MAAVALVIALGCARANDGAFAMRGPSLVRSALSFDRRAGSQDGQIGSAPGLEPVSVVPRPRAMRRESGLYRWPSTPRIGARNAAERNVARLLRAYLASNGVVSSDAVAERDHADVAVTTNARYEPRLGDEGYELAVRPGGVSLRANTGAGLFYALQTLEQVTARTPGGLRSAAVTIADVPEYHWRGIHLDVARHFFPVRVVERTIDLAAHYKLNVFHWHLTDDEAWRLRSARYPALASGGESYSAADVREVVAYAAARHVTVVPEIDLPAHAGAALRAYPQLSCGHDTICTTGAGLDFARTVLGEVMAAFPSPYVHAGGDEVPALASASQQRFTRALEDLVASRGRRLAGWDEIFTPALSPRTVVTVWRGRARAAAIARHGNDVVIASAPLYFDAAQGDPAQEPPATRHMSTLEQVYTDSLDLAAQAGPGSTHVLGAAGIHGATHVLGVQANVWTEHIATEQHLDYMMLPRMLALAEIAWTPRERKSWPSFLARLPAQFAWLEAHHYAFRIPNAGFAFSGGPVKFAAVPAEVQSVRVTTSAPALTMTLAIPIDGAAIRYTTDGTAPSSASPLYRKPLSIRATRAPLTVRAAAFYRGRHGAITESTIVRVSAAALRAQRGASLSWAALVSP